MLFFVFIKFFQGTKYLIPFNFFPSSQKQGDVGPIDLDKKTTTLEPDQTSSGGLFVPGKERVVFKPSERKSLLGMIFLAYIFVVLALHLFPSSRKPKKGNIA